jgi:hypothetical protein
LVDGAAVNFPNISLPFSQLNSAAHGRTTNKQTFNVLVADIFPDIVEISISFVRGAPPARSTLTVFGIAIPSQSQLKLVNLQN